MGKKVSLVLALIIMVLLSCKKENFDNNSIIGQWQWIMSTMGDRGYAITAESVDSTFYIEFNKDGFYSLYDNSKDLLVKHQYELGTDGQVNTYKILDSNTENYANRYNIHGDTLSTWNIHGITFWTLSFIRLK